MQHFVELESERIVLECRRCGEMMILLGREEDWYSEGRTIFGCECGESLTIAANRLAEEVFSIKQLLRGMRVPNGR
jgi:hypothetical protein